jgi:hypothetical protein
MPRFYFDLVDDKTVYDHKGVTLPDAGEARKFAATFVRELMENKPTLLGETAMAWSVKVSNGRFEPVFTIPFTDFISDEPGG